jgi:hypothetical protein
MPTAAVTSMTRNIGSAYRRNFDAIKEYGTRRNSSSTRRSTNPRS